MQSTQYTGKDPSTAYRKLYYLFHTQGIRILANQVLTKVVYTYLKLGCLPTEPPTVYCLQTTDIKGLLKTSVPISDVGNMF